MFMNQENDDVVELSQEEFREAVMKNLTAHDIAKVVVEFDGYGDEGQSTSMECTKRDGAVGSLDFLVSMPGKIHKSGDRYWDPVAKSNVTIGSDRPMTMREVLDEWIYELLEETGVDWINSEGGFGDLVITPGANSIECELNERVTKEIISFHSF
jgi:hypothetical protein